jgi:hypothetical protein
LPFPLASARNLAPSAAAAAQEQGRGLDARTENVATVTDAAAIDSRHEKKGIERFVGFGLRLSR